MTEPRKPKTGEQFREFYSIGTTMFHALEKAGHLRVTRLGKTNLILPDDEDVFFLWLQSPENQRSKRRGGRKRKALEVVK